MHWGSALWRAAGPMTRPGMPAAPWLFAIAALGPSAWADDEAASWSRFRGPGGSGIAVGRPPVRFGPEQNVLWKVKVPPGHSSPVLGRGRVFLTAFEGDQLVTLCLDSLTGTILWRRAVLRERRGHLDPHNTPASPTPVTDGENVYAFYPDLGVIAYSAGGRERWRLPLGPFNNFFGMAASPVLADDRLVLQCDQDTGSFILAVDTGSGRVLWRRERPQARSGHSTPVVHRGAGGEQLVVTAGSFQLAAYSTATGEKRWWVNGLPFQIKALPVLAKGIAYVNGSQAAGLPRSAPPDFRRALALSDSDGDGLMSLEEAARFEGIRHLPGVDLDRNRSLSEEEWDFFRAIVASRGGLAAIRVDQGPGDRTAGSLAWRYERSVPEVASVIVYEGVLFMINDGGVLTSLDPSTGSVLKQGRLTGAGGSYFASPVAADGKIFLANDAGDVAVMEAGAEGRVLAVNRFGEAIYATPAPDRERIYIRTAGHLYCLRQQPGKGRPPAESASGRSRPSALPSRGAAWPSTFQWRRSNPVASERRHRFPPKPAWPAQVGSSERR